MFALDPRLQGDSHPLGESSLNLLRLFDDARYLWLVLVPKIDGAVEWADLDDAPRRQLFDECMLTAVAVKALVPGAKANLGQLGNVVRQLHVHVLARREGDSAWPGPVWGHSPRVPYGEAARHALTSRLRATELREAFRFV